LLCDVVARADESAWQGIERALSLDAAAIERLRACVESQLASTLRDRSGMALLFQEHASLEDDRRHGLEERRARYGAVATSLVEEGQSDGSIVRHVDAALSGAALMEAARGVPNVAATATALILAGLETQ
jgi:hypothetical protein